MSEPLSLRERKKQRTRVQIVEASRRLFKSQGYDATTLEQVCAEIDISVPTLLAYFPSKERLALADEWQVFDELREQIEDPSRSEDTLSLWRAWVARTAAWTVQNRRKQLSWLAIEAATPALVRARLSILQAYEDVLAEGLAADNGTHPEKDLPTRLLATMLAFGYRTVVRQWRAAGGEGDLVADATAVIDVAAKNFRVRTPRTRR